MKRLLMVAFLGMHLFVCAQEVKTSGKKGSDTEQSFELISSLNGIDFLFKRRMIEEDEKYTVFILEIMYRNSSDDDIYYEAYDVEERELAFQRKKLVNRKVTRTKSDFATVFVDNAVFGSEKELVLSGTETSVERDGMPVFVIKRGKDFIQTLRCEVRKGNEPMVTVLPNNNVTLRRGI